MKMAGERHAGDMFWYSRSQFSISSNKIYRNFQKADLLYVFVDVEFEFVIYRKNFCAPSSSKYNLVRGSAAVWRNITCTSILLPSSCHFVFFHYISQEKYPDLSTRIFLKLLQLKKYIKKLLVQRRNPVDSMQSYVEMQSHDVSLCSSWWSLVIFVIKFGENARKNLGEKLQI